MNLVLKNLLLRRMQCPIKNSAKRTMKKDTGTPIYIPSGNETTSFETLKQIKNTDDENLLCNIIINLF